MMTCDVGGDPPVCDDEALRLDLGSMPPDGDHTLPVTTPDGLVSNELMAIVP
jgi:hypothetical protein